MAFCSPKKKRYFLNHNLSLLFPAQKKKRKTKNSKHYSEIVACDSRLHTKQININIIKKPHISSTRALANILSINDTCACVCIKFNVYTFHGLQRPSLRAVILLKFINILLLLLCNKFEHIGNI